ncbi:hypothetical protein [Paracraurococcus ruber]|uniref:Transposase n=1 Tax=Paracraurococcus ruber TaxID=77675 RepID=A0ABS1D7C6_9PROT|nr:hypothetical protein [Paracraurococcus ruber]MBK1661774.1 hypothetical protein [Paracraurococcus ruber]TDG18670.1 hypothetical protein E2C05_27990 [Paracraurococcus ruber]
MSNPPEAALLLELVALRAEIRDLRAENEQQREVLESRAGEIAALRHLLLMYPCTQLVTDLSKPRLH